VVKAAKNLDGKMLLIHGSIDDNAHMRNSIQFIYELQAEYMTGLMEAQCV